MSAPTPAPGDDRPREGYYPDPSIPGYVRYWNGAAWVPGTSRPAPKDGESLAPPPGAGTERPAAPAGSSGPASGASVASVEATGPHFFDEDPVEDPAGDSAGEPAAAGAQHGSRPEPAAAWGVDRSRQSGFGGDQDRRVSWGVPQGAQGDRGAALPGADPRVPLTDRGPAGESARTDGTAASAPPAGQQAGAAPEGATFVFRRPAGTPGAGKAPAADAPDDGTMTFRAVPPRTSGAAAGPGTAAAGQGGGPGASGPAAQGGSAASAPHPGAPAFGAADAAGPVSAPAGPAFGGQAAAGGPGSPPSGPAFSAQGGATGSADGVNRPGFGAGKAAAARAAAGQAGAAAAGVQASAQAAAAASTALSGPPSSPAVPPQSAGPGPGTSQPAAPAPLSPGPGGGQSSWAQQVHRLAGAGGGDEQPVAPWKPPVDDVFQAAARRQAAARPAGLGKRLAARLVDTVVVLGVTAAAAVPLGTRAVDHVNEKIEAARLSGETVTVWLLDGTTSTYLGIVLAVLLLVGVVSEVLPTAKWGRTLGKKLMGLDVRDIEGHDAPGFGAALRRWLVYSVPGLLVVGVVGVAWCLFDRPWRQCWHDKAAHTFVAG
ncbi:RDD family protein [Streptomyces sp. NPDC058735]|uniref:RDD family protein n=1 Tax=Streptomyces sp. NPDC058735 TaxID=3346616 RepID=UPI00367B52A4